jgi:glutamyl-tRNA synthetase
MTPAVTRFAPSPTGSLHVGGARTALYCYLWARHTGGRFILRIEDTDQKRSSEASTRGIVRDMEWLGIAWDEGPLVGGPNGPYFQSERLERYTALLKQLHDEGHAYEAWETGAELGQMRAEAESKKETFRYRRRAYSDSDLARFREEGRTPVLRLAYPPGDVTLVDSILGPVTVEADQLDDLVIRKADGFPTYHFAVVADDHDMEITQILRGQEHLTNTHKHHGIATLLGWELPAPGHMPLIFNLQGGKMSKREKAKTARAAARDIAKREGKGTDWAWLAEAIDRPLDEVFAFMKKKSDSLPIAEAIAMALSVDLPMIDVMDFRSGGYLPEAILNYLALLGWRAQEEGGGEGDRELYTLDELVERFDLERIKKTAAKFDPQKLKWMNGEYIKSLPMSALLSRFNEWLEVADSHLTDIDDAAKETLITMYGLWISTWRELETQSRFFFEAPTVYGPPKALRKHLKNGGLARLADTVTTLGEVVDWTASSIHDALAALAEANEQSIGRYAQPLRIALTGTPVSPPIDETLAMLGKKSSLARIQSALETLEDPDQGS